MRPQSLNAVLMTLLSLTTTLVSSHSWIEELTVIGPNGTFTGAPGYARGNVLRTAAGFNDNEMVNLLPPNGRPTGNTILPTDGMCRASQASPNQTPGSPALNAAPNSLIALRYQENGHVTFPQNPPGKPPQSGKVYVYGTTSPQPDDKFLSIHNVWNADGSGGDKRGKLLTTQTFDDGQCYQVNGGPISQQRQKQFPHTKDTLMGADLWCQTDLQLPTDAQGGNPYTLYWVWDWSTLAQGSTPALTEIYTTCMDVDVTNGSPAQGSPQFVKQDLVDAAVQGVFQKIGSAAPPASPNASPSPSPSPQQPAGPASAPQSAAPAQAPSQQAAQAPPPPASSSAAQAPPPSASASAAPSSQAPQAQQQPAPSIKTVYVTLVPTTMAMLVPSTMTVAPTGVPVAKRDESTPSSSASTSIAEDIVFSGPVHVIGRYRPRV